uniref:Gamma-secretase subunit PEN-2 n=1 Tax=Ditylenchus dipsaci TaxID=166011 RepID=A0A915DMP5_9BILA
MAVNLQKTSNEDKLKLCKHYFYIGIALLPLVWLANVVWFYKYAYCKEEFAEQKSLKFYIRASFLGMLCWLVVIVAWTIFFQTNRAKGIAWSDYLTFVFPVGYV